MHRLLPCLALLVGTAASAQRPVTAADSALIGRILLAEDRRDSSASAIAEGLRHSDARISVIARRARSRIRDPKFTARDSLPALAAPPKYTDPAWRIRLRELRTIRADCETMRHALAHTAWPVRLAAADTVAASCGSDAAVVGILVDWATGAPANARRTPGGVSFHAAGHAIVALAKLSPDRARRLLPTVASNPVPWLRAYAARAARLLSDTSTLQRLARDANDNVKEAAIDALARVAGHSADDDYVAALSARGYQAVRAGARALKGSPKGAALVAPLVSALRRIAADSNEPSRDARMALVERAGEFTTAPAPWLAAIGNTFDCEVTRAVAAIAARVGAAAPKCTPLAISLPADAVSLALGRDVRLRVTLADSSGGRSFVVRLRGDVAPIMAARILALARSGYYNGRTWHRVEPDFVIQGGGGGTEYIGYPRFFRDELGTVPH
ncbi:MAG: peptidylprolyl isomerase, partial [bacterium]